MGIVVICTYNGADRSGWVSNDASGQERKKERKKEKAFNSLFVHIASSFSPPPPPRWCHFAQVMFPSGLLHDNRLSDKHTPIPTYLPHCVHSNSWLGNSRGRPNRYVGTYRYATNSTDSKWSKYHVICVQSCCESTEVGWMRVSAWRLTPGTGGHLWGEWVKPGGIKPF